MEFRIADTFTDSLARLTGEEQKAVKTTAFDLQLDPAGGGLSFHRLDKAKDKNFWSVRVNSDIRLIVHRSANSLLLCYVDHHDKAYAWAERRKLETHPQTGAAQLVEIRETVQEILVPVYIESPQPAPSLPPLFSRRTDAELLGYGVPAEWLDDVRGATADTLLNLADHLPAEAAEALLELAVGGQPPNARPVVPATQAFEHPDAQRRFRVVSTTEELARALDFPWDKWTIFLHPEQRQLVERDYSGPARVSGSAGTGKTIVALHRAVMLARRNPDSRVLLTTFSDILARELQTRLFRLVKHEAHLAERIDVYSIDALSLRLYKTQGGSAPIAAPEITIDLIQEASEQAGSHAFTQQFLRAEWDNVIDANQLTSWEEYRDVARLGRKTRLSEPQRRILWSIFERVQKELEERNLITPATLFAHLTRSLESRRHPPFDFVVVDEAQDMGVAHLKFFAALGRNRPDALFFAADQGQRIFHVPFSWRGVGVDVRGRSRTLRVNYRTSHQIRFQADRLLNSQLTDADGNVEERAGTVSVFNGPPPLVHLSEGIEEETDFVGDWLANLTSQSVPPGEMGVFVRSEAELERAQSAVESAGLPFQVLNDSGILADDKVTIGTMHGAKGLEFRAVAVIACDDEIIPSQERIETVGDESDLQEVYDTERHLLYVACTRARDFLLVSGVEPASEFLSDLQITSKA